MFRIALFKRYNTPQRFIYIKEIIMKYSHGAIYNKKILNKISRRTMTSHTCVYKKFPSLYWVGILLFKKITLWALSCLVDSHSHFSWHFNVFSFDSTVRESSPFDWKLSFVVSSSAIWNFSIFQLDISKKK